MSIRYYYSLKADEPYQGYTYTLYPFVLKDGLLLSASSDNPKTLDETERLVMSHGYYLVSDAKLDELNKVYIDGRVTLPRKITLEHYNEMLNILPPCKWMDYSYYSGFHVVERITGNLVSWYFSYGNECYTFDDYSNSSPEHLISKLHK